MAVADPVDALGGVQVGVAPPPSRHGDHRQPEIDPDVVQLGEHGAGVQRAAGRFAAGRPLHQLVELAGDAGQPAGRGRHVGVDVLVGHRHRAVADVGGGSGEQLEEDHAGGVHVGAGIGGASRDLLRRAVGHGAHHQAGAGAAGIGLHRPGQAEVGHLHHAVVGQQDVLRLHVPVHQAGPVGGGERGQHRFHDGHRLRRAERTTFAQQIPQRATAYQLHHQEHVLAVDALVIDRHRVQVRQPGGDPGLPGEPVGEGRVVGQRRGHHLDRDRTLQPFVHGAVHGGHAAPSQPLENPVPAFEHPADDPISAIALGRLHQPILGRVPRCRVRRTDSAANRMASRGLCRGGRSVRA